MFAQMIVYFLLLTSPAALQWARYSHLLLYPTDTDVTDRELYREGVDLASGYAPQTWVWGKTYLERPRTLQHQIWTWLYFAQTRYECFAPDGSLSNCQDHPEGLEYGHPVPMDRELATRTWALTYWQWAPSAEIFRTALLTAQVEQGKVP